MKNKTLSFKLVVGGLIAVIIPIVVLGLVSVWKSSSSLEDEARQRSVEIVKGLANMTGMVLQEKLNLASEFAMRGEVIEAAAKASSGSGTAAQATAPPQGDSYRIADALKILVKSSNDYEMACLADPKGNVFVDNLGGKTVGLNIAERDYFKGITSGKASIGTPVKSKMSGKPTVSAAAPIRSSTGEILGAVILVIKIDFLVEKFAMIKIGKTGYAYLLDKTGMCIAHPKQDLILKVNILQQKGMEDIAKKMLAHETGADIYSFQGVKKIGGFTPVALTEWLACATQDYNELMEPAHMLRYFILVIGLIFLAVTAVAVFFSARKISVPIAKAVHNLNEGALQIAGAAGQVSATSQTLSEGASEAAASIEETSSSLEELSSMTRKNAENANYSKGLMAEARQIVEKVNGNIKKMTDAIAEVTTSSEQTGHIIKTIDEIAFQTNLLALNAAVEAARAGEAGAGFAVVADEVRNLAMRAAEAAKTTSALIENTISGIRNSKELTAVTQTAFQENIDISVKIGALVDEIAAASDEQAKGIEHINLAMAEMDKITQRNAAHAEESASASEEMSAQAEQMKQVSVDLNAVVGGVADRLYGNGWGQAGREYGAQEKNQAALLKMPDDFH